MKDTIALAKKLVKYGVESKSLLSLWGKNKLRNEDTFEQDYFAEMLTSDTTAKSDEDIDAQFKKFGKTGAMRMKKARLTQRLENSLLFLALNKEKHKDLYYYVVCIRLVAICQIASSIALGGIAKRVALKGLEIADEYEFTEQKLSLLLVLQIVASSQEQDKYEEYTTRVVDTLNTLKAEITSENFAMDKRNLWGRSKNPAEHVPTREDVEKINDVQAAAAMYNTRKLHLMYYRLCIHSVSIAGYENFPLLLEYLDEALEYCESVKEYVAASTLQEFRMYRLNVMFRLGQSAEIMDDYEQLLQEKTTVSGNRFILLFNTFCVALHTENHVRAAEICLTAHKEQLSYTLRVDLQELWELSRKYVQYLREANRLVIEGHQELQALWNDNPKFTKRVVIEKLLNLQRDKGGANLCILLLEFLLLIHRAAHSPNEKEQQGFVDILTTKDESLRHYATRSLQAEGNDRFQVFFAMMQTVIKKDFYYPDILQATKQPYASLCEKNDHIVGLEILPLQTAWKYILEDCALLSHHLHGTNVNSE